MKTTQLIALAAAYLAAEEGLHTYEARGLHIHHCSASGSWWLVDDDDLETLGQALEDEEPEAYSEWCQRSASEVDVEHIVLDWGFDSDDSSADFDKYQALALSRGNWGEYMALKFLRDDIETIIEQNAEIMAEIADGEAA